MKDFNRNLDESPWLSNLSSESSLREIVHAGAEKLVRLAVMAEFEEMFSQYSHLKDKNGKQLVVRNGYHRERPVMTTAGNIRVRVPRLNDRRKGKGKGKGEGAVFHSKVVPPYLRRSIEVDEFIPYLYLKGISSGDFSDVLSHLFGEEVSLSAQTVSRLKKSWESEYCDWNQRELSGKRYVYWWVDGIHFRIRMESEKSCILVVIGVLCNGQKELLAIEEGPRESELSWRTLLLNLKNRGLSDGPLLAIGDGALGFWNALKKEYPQTRHQRCWVHKTANVLDKLPKSVHPEAKRQIHEIYLAPTKEKALRAFDTFLKLFEAKYPRASECLLKDKEETLAFYDFPAEHVIAETYPLYQCH